MALGAFLPLAVFVVIAGGVSFRLLGLWRRTRAVPEGALGLGLLVVTLSMPLSAIGRSPALAMEPLGRAAFAAGLAGAAAGITLLVFFNLHVFRRDVPWARALFTGIAVLLGGSVAYMSAANFAGASVLEIKEVMRPGTLLLMATTLGCFAWGAAESLLSHAAARRRLALGLGDAVVANRFLLWGVASIACAALLVVTLVCVLLGMVILREPIPLAAIAACGVIMSGCWYLTFFTPERYRRFVLARAGGEPSP